MSKVSGLSEDSVFMGTLEAVPVARNTACAWLLGGGGGAAVGGAMGFGITLIAADDRFLDWLGYDTSELVGQPVGGLLENEEVLNRWAQGAGGAAGVLNSRASCGQLGPSASLHVWHVAWGRLVFTAAHAPAA